MLLSLLLFGVVIVVAIPAVAMWFLPDDTDEDHWADDHWDPDNPDGR